MKYLMIILLFIFTGFFEGNGQNAVPLHASGNSSGFSTGNDNSLLSVTGQNAIGEMKSSEHKIYLGMLAPVRYVLTTGETTNLSRNILYQNYPNPSNNETIIPFEISNTSEVKLSVFNVLGQPVEILADKKYPPGKHKIRYNTKTIQPGIYFYQLQVENFQAVKNMVVTK